MVPQVWLLGKQFRIKHEKSGSVRLHAPLVKIYNPTRPPPSLSPVHGLPVFTKQWDTRGDDRKIHQGRTVKIRECLSYEVYEPRNRRKIYKIPKNLSKLVVTRLFFKQFQLVCIPPFSNSIR